MQQRSGRDRPCGLCQVLSPATQGSSVQADFQSDHGTPASLKMRPDCPMCRLILKMLPSERPTIPYTGRILLAGTLHEGIRVFYENNYQGLITSDLPVNTSSESSTLMYHLIKDWITECENHHHDDVSTLAPRYKHPVDIILIDVLDQKLVRASSSWRFLAISYVWGKAALEITTTANRRAREQMGALSKVNLPQLILDAMLFVSQLGERYLWVDCLCIEQDNLSQKHSQVSQMDVIYSQSLLTLVALSSEDAGSFLPGVRSESRAFFKAKEYVFDINIYALYPRLLELSEATVYESRGWTFQERLLSRRCLFLTDCDMYYTCHSHLLCETGANSVKSEEIIFKEKFLNIFAHLDSIRKMWPSWTSAFRLYASLVHEYSKRELSYDTDVINAFSGISSVLGHFLSSGSVSGLIECVLDVCLLWVPGNSNTHIRNHNFPSWSWAGWRGEVIYLRGPLCAYGAECYQSSSSSSLLLVTLIDRFETQSLSPLRPIFRLLQQEGYSIVANKKSEKVAKGVDLLCFEAGTADIAQLSLSSRETVVRGDFYLASDAIHSRSIRICLIMEANQKTCGYLHFFPRALYPSASAPNHRELVALSLSQPAVTSAHRPPAELAGIRADRDTNRNNLFDEDIFKPKPWCLVNIMLVEWKGSEAERITVGQIHIDAWNALRSQRKRIRLI